MQDRFDRLVSVTLAICALGVLGTVVHREFAAPVRPAPAPLDRPEFVPNWKDALTSGISVGDPAAQVKVVEFADLECPFCRRFHEDMMAVMKKHPKDVALVF